MKKKYILICLILFISIIIAIIVSINKKNGNQENPLNKITETSTKDNLLEEKIENIKQDLGYNNTDATIYEIKTEYDGREVIAIKPNIQYNVAMAGAIKNEKPQFNEIDMLLKDAPNKTGIWIEKNSREKFLNILKDITNGIYKINDEGYLEQEQTNNYNEIDYTIKNAINNKKIFSICINSKAYVVDEVTGNIEEYPFEEMDPESPYELFEIENASLYVITQNKYQKLEYKNIFKEVFNNMTI